MDLDPGLHHAHLCAWKHAGQQLAAVDGELSLLPLILRVNVGQVVLLGVEEVHADQDAVEAADGGHVLCPVFVVLPAIVAPGQSQIADGNQP